GRRCRQGRFSLPRKRHKLTGRRNRRRPPRRWFPNRSIKAGSRATGTPAGGRILLGQQRARHPRGLAIREIVGKKSFEVLGFVNVERDVLVLDKTERQTLRAHLAH